ncbi:hypothetical protein [Legionella fallonii]|uniref:Uncharacterized protein n=1 Tax=Legionella fallonii LLAP-10 TaxID=1212491 RepID=A0A098G148_9GAMM|nr:hypothetical protein [Legionella fallonii]CEG56208.1 conserved protein of unknown function [Legionella fallonii LLAP-10]
MSKRTNTKPPLLSREECDALLPTCCVNAMSAHKLNCEDSYLAEIDSLSKICDNLVTHHHETFPSVIAQMEKVMTDAHNHEMEEIDKKIKHLFNLRKQTPCNSSYCEQEVIKLTTEIHMLEERKAIPVKDTIQGIIYESVDKAIRVLGAEPGNFNLSQYEYRPVFNESDTKHQANHGNETTKSNKQV